MATSSDSVSSLSGINDLVVCAYNSAHMVGASRIQQHLIKCRKQNPEKAKDISICPYNQSHHFPTEDFSLHMIVCRDYLAHKFQQVDRKGQKPFAFVEPPEFKWRDYDDSDSYDEESSTEDDMKSQTSQHYPYKTALPSCSQEEIDNWN